MPNERKNITQPDDWWAAFEAAAKKAGQPLAEWLGDAGKDKLPKAKAAKLTKRVKRGKPKKPQGKS